MVDYPFLNYIKEDKSRYQKARDAGYVDDDDLFLIGESGGFLLNINPDYKFVDTHLFYERADMYRETGKYSTFKVDSINDRQIRKREQHRRKYGFTAPCLMNVKTGEIMNVRITGSHYNFLNYNRMEQLNEKAVKVGKTNTATKHYDFAKFFDSQFWIFHILEFAQNNGFHILIDKTRRGGFSYIMSSDSANIVNLNSRKVVIHVANDSKYLTMRGGLTDFSLATIRFYESETPFKRGVYSTINTNFTLGYKNKEGNKAVDSWDSALLSVSAFNNPDCAIGKDAVCIKVEEVSTMENFDEFMTVTEPTMRTGAYTTGLLVAWGTATSGNMQVFERNFYDPKAYGFMPFENVWDKDARSEVCGFFKPYCWGLQGEMDGVKGIDADGNSNIEVGLQIALEERAYKKENAKSFAEYVNYLGQYAIYPSESFSSATENIFTSEELIAFENRLRVDNELHFYTDGMFDEAENGSITFKSNKRLAAEGKKVYDYIQGVPRKSYEDPHGCIRIFFHPEYEDTPRGKIIPQGLYSISYDPVGVNKAKDEITNKHSHNCIYVWQNPHYLNGYKSKLVACYYGRPDNLKDADRICYQLARYYNCIGTVCVEVDRGETVTNFKSWNATRYLAFEPLYVFDTTLKGKVGSSYGYVIGDGVKKLESIRLLKEMLYEVIGQTEFGTNIYAFERILDYQTIIELKKWNSKGNYDRVSALLIRAIEYKGFNIKAEGSYQTRQKVTEEGSIDELLNRSWF